MRTEVLRQGQLWDPDGSSGGTCSPWVCRFVVVAVGNEDGCGYCQSAHTLSAVQAGFSEEQTVAIRNARIDFDSRLQALLAVAREIAGNLGEVADTTYERAQQAGWSDEELTELYAHVAVNMFTNYFNHYAGTELDIPAAFGVAG